MWLLAIVIPVTIAAVLLRRTRWEALALRVSRWTYAAYIVAALLYYPVKAGFQLTPVACQWTFGPRLAVHSLTNFPHIILLGIFFLITYAQLPGVPRAMLWTAGACLLMGLLVEFEQGMTGLGHCRMRDLIPDSAGTLIGALLVAVGRKVWANKRAR
jgi:hypothetical protein